MGLEALSFKGREIVMVRGVRWLGRLVVPFVCVGIGAALTLPALAEAVSGTTLTIYKVNQANQPLAGASFVLSDLSGTPVGTPPTVITDVTGHATFGGVAAGKYTLHELSAPPGYSTSQDIGLEVGAGP